MSVSGCSCRVLIVLVMSVVGHSGRKVGNPVTISATPAQNQPAAAGNGQSVGGYGAPNQGQQQPAAPYGGMVAQGYGMPPPMHMPPQQQQQAYQPQQPALGAYGATAPAGGYGGYGAPPQSNYGAPAPHAYNTNSVTKTVDKAQYGGHGSAPPQPHYAPAAGGAIARNEAPPNLLPINALNSFQNRWTIKARVTQKAPIKRYSNARGEGKFFSFDLLDSEGGEIRVVGWNEQCDRFFDQVENGKVYYISKASLRNKRGTYNQTRHQFEVHLESGSQIELAPDEPTIPKISFNFVPISRLEDTPAGTVVDIIAVTESVEDQSMIRRRDGSEATKRSISVKDPSGRSIEVTLWGEFASQPGDQLAAALSSSKNPVIAIKGARVGEFNGKNLSTVSSSTVMVDPQEVAETQQLHKWYMSGGANQEMQALSGSKGMGTKSDRRVCISQIRGEGLGLGGQAAWVQVLCYMTYARNENFCYPGCPSQYNGKQCNKKLIDQTGDGTSWYCERCGISAPEPDYRYILSCQFGDHTDASWVTAFNESAPSILGVEARDLKAWGDAMDPRFSAIFRDSQFKPFILKLRVSEDTYQEETRLRMNVVRVDAVDYKKETTWTLDAIKRIEKGEPAYPAKSQPAQSHQMPHTMQPGGYGQPQPVGSGYPGMQQPWNAPPVSHGYSHGHGGW